MKLNQLRNFLWTILLLIQCQLSIAQIIPAELGIIPWPKNLTENVGNLNLTVSSSIVYADPSLQALANILKDDIGKITGLNLAVTSGTANAGDIELLINNSLQDEGYTLDVNSKIIITAKDYRAVVWGISTLLQSINSDGSVKKISISDSPDTNYRGLMVDLARQWHPIENIEDIINMCRLYKIKYLHLHLMDSQYFTFPSQAYPLLPTPGFSYSLAEMQGLEAYSQARGVTIVPELEVPGHAGAMIAAYPNLFGSGTSGAINFARADVRAAVGTLVGEIADVFQATPYFHIGCDEVDKSGMGSHPDYVNAITTYNVGDVEGLFNYFINEVNGYVKAEGKTTLAWEGFDSGRTGNAKVDTDVIVCPFDNYTSADVYANNGHDILNTSWFPLYLIGSTYVPTEKIYSWNKTEFGRYASPFPFSHNNPYQYTMTNTSKIIGAQTCSWEQRPEYEIPSLRSRLSPMSEKIWNTNAGRTFEDYQTRFAKSDQVLTTILATVVPEAITPSASYEVFSDKIAIRWRAEGQYPTAYTLYRSTSNNNTTATPILSNTTLTSYDDTNVSNGQTYYYWIKAHNTIGTSTFGNSADGRKGSLALVNMYEPFDYAANAGLNGLNGGNGFSNGWNITGNNGTIEVTGASLTYPNLMTGGNSLSIEMDGTTNSFWAERSLAGSFCPEGSEVWLSFLIKANKVADGHCFLIFGDGSIGKKWGNGIYFKGTNVQLGLVDGETNLVVLKIESFNGADNVHIWTNPAIDGTPPDMNDPNLYFTDREDLGTNPKVALNVQRWGEGRYELDEFRVGDSFDDVLPTIVGCADADGDSVCDADDICPNGDDNLDNNNNGIPDACDAGVCLEEALDDFDYIANTSIDAANGGTGFSDAWSVGAVMNGSVDVLSGSLSYAGHNSSGNKLRMTLQNEDATKWISRNLTQAFQNGDTVWMTCLIQPISLADGGFWIKPNGRQDIAIGKRWGSQIAIDNSGTGISVQENTVSKLVVRYILESNQTRAHLWINRNDNFTDANADATKTVGSTANISSVQIAMERWGDGVMEIDELHIGCSPNPTISCDPSLVGTSCDDGDVCTTGETYDSNCNCSGGTFQDLDGDSICDANDACPNDDTNTCNDNNDCDNLLPQQQNLVLGERTMLIIRGVDSITHTWNNTDTDLATFSTELDTYVRNTSFNKAWVTTEMTPVYDFTVDPNNNGYYPMGQALRTIAINNGYDVDSYNVIAYIHQSTTDFGGAGALGSGNGLQGTLWANNNLSWYYPGNIHETFHAFGVGHANCIDGGNTVYPGQHVEGSDPYYFMGSQGDAGLDTDIPNYMKYWFGWIEPSEVYCLPEVSACVTRRIYKASLVSTYNNQHKYAVQLGDHLWISYEPDNQNTRIVTKGLMLHYIPGPGSAITKLLDIRPESITELPPGVASNYLPVIDFWDAAMEQGDIVNWDGTNITMMDTGGTGDEKWVDIEFCDCLVTSGDDDIDGVCNDLDVCPNSDDNLDTDGDNIPDACDDCPLAYNNDSNEDGICDNLQCLRNAAESFSYPISMEIDTANGGLGFNGNWTKNSPDNGVVEFTSGSLSYPDITSIGEKLHMNIADETTNTASILRELEGVYTNGDEFWMSVLIKANNIGAGGFWIKPGNRQDIAIGKRWGTQFSIDNNSSVNTIQGNTTHWLVARYRLEATQTIAELWVDPDPATFDVNVPDATKIAGSISNISSVAIAIERYGLGDYEIDELRFDCQPPAPLEPNCIDIQLQVMLEGAYDITTTEMSTKLNTERGLLPGQTPLNALVAPTPSGQPYSANPWNYNGGEGSDWTDTNYAADIVDWVLISFRTSREKNTEIAQAAALVNKSGLVQFPSCALLNQGIDSVYIVIEHRNHIGIMSPYAIPVINGVLSYDFTAADSYKDTTSFGQKQLANGNWCMFAGDVDQSDLPSYDINGIDKAAWSPENGLFDQYSDTDMNLDGDTNGADKALWDLNNGVSSRVPK